MFNYIINNIIDNNLDALQKKTIDILFESTVEKEDRDIDPTEFVNDVIMFGSLANISRVSNILEDNFEKKPALCVDPDSAVATGAAIYVSSLVGAKERFVFNEKA